METDIRHTESVLNDATDEANDLVERELGERVPDPPNWSKRRPRANKNHVEAALEEIVRRGRGPEADEGLRSAASEAQERLDDIRRLRGQLRELNDELRRARETGSAPSSPTGPEEGGSSVEKLRAEASAYAEKVAKLERSVKAIDTDAAALEKRAAAIRKQLLSQQIDPETFFAQSKALDGERQALANRRKGLSDEASSLRGEAEATVARMVTEMPTEMEATFHSKNPKEILARGHMVEEGSLSASGMFSVFNAVMMAVDIIDGVQYVLDADSVMEGVGRAIEVGAGFAKGAVAGELLAYIAGSAETGVVLGLVLQLSGDQGGARDDEALKEAARKRAKQIAYNEMIAVGKFLEKTAPQSVEWVEDRYQVKDQALWDKTVAELHEMQAAFLAKEYATVRQRAFDLGRGDGRYSNDFVHAGDMKEWKEVKDLIDIANLPNQLFEDYKRGFKVGHAKWLALQERATKRGREDAKAGKPRAPEQVDAWPEIAQAVGQGASPVALLSDLHASYDEAYDAMLVKTR